MTSVVVLAILCVLVGVSGVNMPAKAAIWLPHHRFEETKRDGDVSGKHTTMSSSISSLNERIASQSAKADVVVLMSATGALSAPDVKASIARSPGFEVFTAVYTTASDTGMPGVLSEVQKSDTMRNMRESSAKELCAAAEAGALASHKGAVMHVADSPLSATCLTALAKSEVRVLVVAVEDSHATLPLSEQVRRTLASSSSSSSSAVNSGYTIFYDDTYLLITPEIFTGAMTMLFLLVVALLGFSCLGAIQGPYSFANKATPVGREA